MTKLISDYKAMSDRTGHGSSATKKVSTRASSNWGWNRSASLVDSKGKAIPKRKKIAWQVRYEK